MKNVHYVKGKTEDFFGIEQVEYIVSALWIMQHGNHQQNSRVWKNIYIVNASVCCFECQPLSAIEWNYRHIAYEVEIPYLAQANISVDTEKLDCTPYYYLTFNNSKCILVKYGLTDLIAHHSA